MEQGSLQQGVLSVLLVEVIGWCLVWPEAVCQVYWLWRLLEGAGQDQPLHVVCPGPPGMSYRVICRWLLLVVGLELPRRGQAEN